MPKQPYKRLPVLSIPLNAKHTKQLNQLIKKSGRSKSAEIRYMIEKEYNQQQTP